MKHGVVLLAALAFTTPAAASPLTFEQAKSNADATESSLGPADIKSLLDAQGKLASQAFPACVQSTASTPSDFTVVVQLNAQGVVINSWRQGESSFARCFQRSMERSFSFKPKSQPFFTAFEYANAH